MSSKVASYNQYIHKDTSFTSFKSMLLKSWKYSKQFVNACKDFDLFSTDNANEQK